MLIGLAFQARSGKDTVADYLVRKYNFIQESFAGPLKEFIGRQICGFSSKQLYGEWKEVSDPEWNMTPRAMLQRIGTDAMRDIVHRDFWVIPMRRKIKEHIKNNNHIVISDARFFNEAKLIKEMGGKIVRIDRNNSTKISNPKHISELELEAYTEWDFVLDNNSTIETLYERVDIMMEMF